ncbi:glycoside hydrolase family 3 protein [Gilvimarinus algae]|uniref:Glycoside hydrolase family 3 protein n=1 Tax=Gilvimarinus algae TaxID=3058037 RepID=A0ABT8TEE0_9GAMM|nr:glycoside hydrolase family 3 protein [Gilvimarinus sp. SDUM040014]MDO3381463.1 glycoside hydrolase family 3 protein [Gilvimarinus sp. SDUM040014]
MIQDISQRVSALIEHMSLAEKVGQLFVLGFAGEDVDYARSLVRDCHVGGFYLTQDNSPTPEKAKALNDVLSYESQLRACDAPLLLAVDQEGAWGVLVEYTTTGPGNLALGAADDVELTRQMHQVLASEMRTLGYNTILGPCADINANPDNPIIGVRSFGSDTPVVCRHVQAAVKGLQTAVVSAAKHFPGHGDTGEDSHRLLPSVDKSLKSLTQTDLAPFQAAIDAGVPLIMTSHILYPHIDPANPATLSKILLRDILRKEMGFQGLIITDSMNMWAMRKNYGPAEAAVKALAAGADLIMLSEEHYENNLGGYKDKQRETIDGVIHAVRNRVLDEAIVDQALARVLSYKYANDELFAPPTGNRTLAATAHRIVADKAAKAAIKVIRNRHQLWPLAERPFLLAGASNPDLHQTVIDTRGIGPNEPHAAYQVFEQTLMSSGCELTRVTYEQFDTLLASHKARALELPLVMVTEDYPLPGLDYDTQQQRERIAKAWQVFGDQLVVVALRSDYELTHLPDLATYICAYSSRACSAKAAAERLLGL